MQYSRFPLTFVIITCYNQIDSLKDNLFYRKKNAQSLKDIFILLQQQTHSLSFIGDRACDDFWFVYFTEYYFVIAVTNNN